MVENPNQKRNKPLNNGGQFRMLSIWLLVFFVIFAILFISNSDMQQSEELTIRQVIQEAEKGEESRIVPGAVIKAAPHGGTKWHEIRGRLKTTGGEDITFLAEGQLTEENIQVLQESGLFKEEPASTLFTQVLLNLLPILLILLILYFLFVRQLRSAGRGAMNFGKSKARMLTRDREKVTFKDVAGCDEAKEEVAEVVSFLKDPKRFQRIGGRIPKGALLVGPPGTGKTLLARAVAGEADVPFFSISGSDFVEMFVGVGAARVRDMFEQGRKNAPCIIFVDEIDAVGRQRGAGLGGGNDEREQTLNSLLVEMDGFDGHEGVIIMAATNRPDVLDNALLRPGRFDRQIMIDLPDLHGREEILKVHASKIKLGDDIDLFNVARNTPGFSGADLANLLNESALIAARYNKKVVDRHDVEEARDKIAFGRERRKLMDDEDKRMTAFHEAGHALVQAVIDDGHLPLHKVTIIPRGRALGLTMMLPKKDILGQSRKHLLNQICCAMAGRIGEEIETQDFSNGAANDIKQATKIARHMVCDWGMSDLGPVAFGENQEQVFLGKEINRTQNFSESTAEKIDRAISVIIEDQYNRAHKIVEDHHEALRMIAEALLEHETIEGIHVEEIIKYGEIRTTVETIKDRADSADDEEPEDELAAKKPEDGKKDDGELSAEAAPAPA
ncbi:MAG: ATP-dependent zinc metalloprotease FtsH [Puniceicoccaceae bacterium]